ncbi:hypothetical protein EDC04DRAFT_2602368 [Pisolithus marmoratus]|nr:hypothetical protein EDC04DRAFT_2602368 [Pisolithus marmoratus]
MKPGVGYKTSPAVSEREKWGVVAPGGKSSMTSYSPGLAQNACPERQYADGGHLSSVAFFANKTTIFCYWCQDLASRRISVYIKKVNHWESICTRVPFTDDDKRGRKSLIWVPEILVGNGMH